MISIILPTFNSIQFLPERVETVLNQTKTNWQCIVIDGYSSDGTWEYLKKIAKKDKRFELYQYPPIGVYDAWNKGIKLVRGDYIYIATSDDTMELNCIEKMYEALLQHPKCEVAHCCLTIIDKNSLPVPTQWRNWAKVKFHGDKITQRYVREAPFDGYVHAGWSTVYASLTQLLIKKSVFDKIGLFRTDFGNIADYEWGVRVGFSCNIIHIPEFLATWRRHENQVTADESYFLSADFYKALVKMSNAALDELKEKGYRVPSRIDFNNNYYLYLLRHSLANFSIFSSIKYFVLVAINRPVDALRSVYRAIRKVPVFLSYDTCKRGVDLLINKYGVNK